MKCKAVLREIEELEQGARLSPEAEAHLPTCEECRAFRAERQALRALLSCIDTIEAPPDFDWRLRARLAEVREESAPARGWLHVFAPGARALTVAASVTLLLVAVVVYRQANVQRENSAQASKVPAVNVKENAAPLKVEPQATETLTVVSPNALAAKRNEAGVRVREARSMKANGVRAEGAGQTASQAQRIFSNDSASRGAESLTVAGLQNNTDDGGPVISVRVPSAKASQLRLEDGQGILRTLSPVNFGGQELMVRPDKARLVPASEKGIW